MEHFLGDPKRTNSLYPKPSCQYFVPEGNPSRHKPLPLPRFCCHQKRLTLDQPGYPPVLKATGFGDCCKNSFIFGVKACLPIRCLPAAVSQSHGIAPGSLESNALTIGRAAVPAFTVAILAGTLEADLLLAIARGGGPLYFSGGGVPKGALLRLESVIGIKHAWGFSLLSRGHIGDLVASALRGVIAPAFGGGEAVLEPLALAFGLALALAWGAGAASTFLSLSALVLVS